MIPHYRELTSIKFKKSNIRHALNLLSQTAPGVWKSYWKQIRQNIITIKKKHVSQWLYRGYIFGRPDLPVIHKVDKEGQDVFANEPNTVAGDNDGISHMGQIRDQFHFKTLSHLLRSLRALV